MPPTPSADCLNIVMAASEAVPYAKTGGLADVVGALPLELIKLGHRVTLVLPGYRNFVAGRQSRHPAVRLHIPTVGKSVKVTLEEEMVPVTAGLHPLRVLAVRYDPYFDRPGLYQDKRGDYPDNLERFTLFCRAVLEAVRFLAGMRGESVDVLHLHDWQTALCAVYLKALAQERKGLGRLKTLLTLHNVGYQGVFPGEQFVQTGLPPALFSPSGLEFYGSVNCLKGGIIFSDAVSTVSPTYATEIMTKDFGCGLEGVLAGRVEEVQGITNGIDVTVWNPETDPYLPAHYTVADLSGKQACKRALQRELGLPNRDVPLLAAIGRLTPQKGFDLLAEIIPELMALDVQIALLGTGDRHMEQQFLAARAKHPERIGIFIGFDDGLAHRIEAGADMLVMPSRYEPCGLSQLYSLRYGTVPIVRRTGGLADTVIPFRPSTAQAKLATGFHFIDASTDALLSAILLSLQVYREHDAWHSLIQAGMKTDVSWTQATKQYVQLYRSIVEGDENTTKES
ncbi:MAG: glycogen synthase [Nitrospira sp.]|nr:MAG: glycogen synthase [Nitrospira sp.]